ncbi:MAG: hypothetical protein V4594_05330 [Bacteroidota bacterium]
MTLPPTFNPAILPVLKDTTLKKTLVVVEPGQVLSTAYWLEDSYGFMYTSTPDKDGKPIIKILRIYGPKTIMLDPTGFFENEPSEYYLAIVKGATIVPFQVQDFINLKDEVPEAEALANCVLAELNKQAHTRNAILNVKGDARYQELIKQYGIGVSQCFSQKDLASYLEYVPTYQSRLNSKNLRRKNRKP